MISHAVYAIAAKIAAWIDDEMIQPHYVSFCSRLKTLEEKLACEGLRHNERMDARDKMGLCHAKVSSLMGILDIHRAPATSITTMKREVRWCIENKVLDESIMKGFELYPSEEDEEAKSFWDLPTFWQRDVWLREYTIAEIFKAEAALEWVNAQIQPLVYEHNKKVLFKELGVT